MPIYMDRHNVSEMVTAEDIAKLHQEDLRIQDKFGCRGLTYWFDDKRKTAFCLIEAPDAVSIEKMHNAAHGQVPHRIIEVQPHIVESFLGRIEDPHNPENTDLNIIKEPAFRTIMVAKKNSLPVHQMDAAYLKTELDKYNTAIVDLLTRYKGNTVKYTDDHFLVSFKSASDAVQAALAMRVLFSNFKKDIKQPDFYLKIGISAGVPVTGKQQIFEDAIKLAQRIGDVVKGEIAISSEVKELYNSENFKALGKKENIIALTETEEVFLNRLIDFTELNWANVSVKVDDFCKPLATSKSQLYRKMMELTGKSLNTFIKDYRLGEALKLLNKNKGNISEIAFETGFSSPSYFSKCFLKKFGSHPSAYLNHAE